MPTLLISDLDETIHHRLKRQAAAHGRSVEEEAGVILRDSLNTRPAELGTDWVDAIRALFEPLGGDLPELPREPAPEPIDLSGPEWDPGLEQ